MADYLSNFGDPTRIILGLAGWLTLNLVGIALLVVARRPWHWFPRTALALAVVAAFAWLPGMNHAPAYDLVLLVFAQACVVLAPWFVFPTGRATQRTPRRFSLASLLLAVPLVAIVTALAVRVPEHVWEWSPWLFSWGAAAGLSTLAAAWVGLGIGPWWSRLLMALPGLPSFAVASWFFLSERTQHPNMVADVAGSARWPTRRWLASGALFALTLLLVVPFVGMFWTLAHPPELSLLPLPASNGLDDLERAADRIGIAPDVGVRVGTPWATNQQLDQFVRNNAAVFALAHSALERPCVTQPFDDAFAPSVGRFGKWRHLARGYQAAANGAARNGRIAEAVEYGVDCCRLGLAISRGGVMIDALVGIAVQGIGLYQLASIRDRLDAAAAKELSATLLQFESLQEDSQNVLTRERAWFASCFGWGGGLLQMANRNEESERFLHVRHRNSATVRVLAADLAVRAYHKDKGRLPETLEALVPDYLSTVPLDPFSGHPLLYRAERRWLPGRMLAVRFERSPGTVAAWLRQFGIVGQPPPFVVYSVGPNGTDEGGYYDPEQPFPFAEDYVLEPPMNWVYETLRPYFDWDGV